MAKTAKRARTQPPRQFEEGASARGKNGASSEAALDRSPVPIPFSRRFHGKLLLVLLSVALLTLSFAPLGQFYFAWIGLAPWLFVVRRARTARAAFFWSWLAGTLFFAANMWWLIYVTGPGAAALIIYLGIYWAVIALILRGVGLLDLDRAWLLPWRRNSNDVGAVIAPVIAPASRARRAVASVILIAAIWTGAEWVRGIAFTGLPWLYLGHTQTPGL